MTFKKGQVIEVGVGEYDEITQEVEGGSSYFMVVDMESIEEDVIIDAFGKTENVLYIQMVVDEESIKQAKENPLSKYIN